MATRAGSWPNERLEGMAAFFSRIGYKPTGEWKQEIVHFDADEPLPNAAMFPDGKPARLTANQYPREVFANWLIAPGNPRFARAIVNRVWSRFLGRGIIHDPDDIRPDNPPSNPELLAYLEKEFVASSYDPKRLYRPILNSQVCQLSSIPRTDRAEGSAQFAWHPLRRLEAEVLIDAICQITGATERYSSPIPEPFTFIPEEERSIAPADASSSSSFLEMFGRSPREFLA